MKSPFGSASAGVDDHAAADKMLPSQGSRPPRRSNKKKFVIGGAIIAIIVIIALAVGLGVGLTRKHNKASDVDIDHFNSTGELGNAPNRTAMWRPAVDTKWQIVLSRPLDLDNGDGYPVTPQATVYDIDVFDNPQQTIQRLQTAGIRVICYFSAGSYEDWRPDKGAFLESDMGKPLDGWKGERWLNVSSENVRSIMRQRIKLAASKGCDAIDPDNIDGYDNSNGIDLTQEQAADYIRFLSREAAQYNMTTGLKNAAGIVDDVLDDVAFSVNEECKEKSECTSYDGFINANKPVFNIEYPKDAGNGLSDSSKNRFCDDSKQENAGSNRFSTVIKKMNLDGWVQYCDGERVESKTL
ncbi:hypothetical protein CDD81_1021 [Ophiocordyceps australis]|uniref:alpha-galactosidase n=1 Tax=Ophiocordyceps australis TaxID=1399860 RepID=A0A2C5Y0M4_9HYPO|nr:hypothetical protein CDD81_1021 [Ophiocordyceps australis]